MILWHEFTFEAAHWLPLVAEDHKCRRMHGHSYRVRVSVSGPVGDDGMVIDFAELKAVCADLREQLDHRTLNDIRGLDNPTSEVLAMWIFGRVVTGLSYQSRRAVQVESVGVSETASSGCVYAL